MHWAAVSKDWVLSQGVFQDSNGQRHQSKKYLQQRSLELLGNSSENISLLVALLNLENPFKHL